MSLWGAVTLGILIDYDPPKRHTGYDHLSFWQKAGRLDHIGAFLLAAGMTLFLIGLTLGGAIYPWSSSQVLAALITGIFVLIAFAVYEWKGTATGILHHDLLLVAETTGVHSPSV